MSRQSKISILATLLLAPFILLIHLNTKLELQIYRSTRARQFVDEFRLPSAGELAAFSLNYRSAVADMVWVDAILFGAKQELMRRNRVASTDYAQTLIELDPYLHPIYQWHNSVRYGGNISATFDDLEATNKILREGIEYFPTDWTLAQSLVVNHIGHRFERSSDERIADLEEALHYAQLAAEIDNAPEHMTMLAISMQRRLTRARQGLSEHGEGDDGSLRATPEELSFLIQRYLSAPDEASQNFFRYRLYTLGAEENLIALVSTYQRQFDQAHRTSFAYLPDIFYIALDNSLYTWDSTQSSDYFSVQE